MATIDKIPKCPPLRFPDFNDDWKETTLGEIAERITRKNDTMGNHPIMMISAEQGFIFQSERYERDNAGKSLKEYTLLYKGELAYNRGASKRKKFGSIFTLRSDSAIVPYVYHCFRVNELENNSMLLGYYLNSSLFDKKLGRIISSSARMDGLLNVSKDDFFALPISFPSLAEQKKIADFLSLIDERIQSCSETIKELKTQKAGLLNQLFSQKLRFPDFNDEWTQTTLGEATIIIMGQSPSSVNYNEEKIGLPLIQGNADMCSGTTIVRLYTSEITKEALKNDIIMSVRAPVGALAITPFRCCIGRGVCAIRADKYIYYYLQSCSKIWFKYSAGSTFDSITGENIRHLPISLPTLSEQKKIADFLSLVDERIEVEEQLLKKYEEQKKYLLRHMFV